MKPVLLQCKEWLAKNALLPYYGVLDSQGPCCILTTTKCRSDARRQLHKKLRHYRQNGIFELDSSSWSLQFFNAISDSKKKSCLLYCILIELLLLTVNHAEHWMIEVCLLCNSNILWRFLNSGKYFDLLLFLVLSLHLTFVTWRKQTYFSGFAQY